MRRIIQVMKNRLSIAAILFTMALPANANEGLDLAAKSKSMAAAPAAATAGTGQAPFMASRDPLAGIFLREEQERRGPSGTCTAAATDLCYDLTSGRLTYRGARQYMPQVDGLSPESVSLRRGSIVLRYTFK